MSGALPVQRRVSKAKITDYLLNPRHKVGAAKAAFFSSFGFSLERWQEMAAALTAYPDRNLVEKTEANPYGSKYVVRCRVETPDGRNPCIRTVWIDEGNGSATLITAYPAEQQV